ncbi:cytochrome P450 [Neofusicoccum parvum]|nr:cytochrome P450 [Neofusicoccum parvum]
MQSTDRLIEYGLNLFRRSREPFAVKVLGEQVYAITSPEDAVLVYKCTTAFSWDVYLNKLLVGFGLRDDALKVAWHKPEPGEACYIHENPLNPQHKSMIHAIEDVYKQQLLPGDKLEEIIQMAIARMEDTLRWEQFLGPFLAGHTKTHKRISVAQFCRIKVTYITTGAMFGDAMFKLQPNLTELMMDLSDNAWALVFGYPKVLLPKKLKHAWKELCGTIRQFWQAPERDRADASWAINSIIQLQEQFEMDDESRDSLLAMISWAANANTVDSAFWLLNYLLFDQDLLSAIREETRPAFVNGSVDVWYLIKNCPLLEATWFEMLRVVNGALSVRKVTAPIVVGGKLLQPGNTVAIPFRQLHFNEHVWGDDRHEFNPHRFLKDQKLRSHPAYRPFGGGASFCPGRYLAMAEACGFVAMFLHRFDVVLSDTGNGVRQRFPLQDDTKPSTGISGVLDNMDVLMDVRPLREEMV